MNCPTASSIKPAASALPTTRSPNSPAWESRIALSADTAFVCFQIDRGRRQSSGPVRRPPWQRKRRKTLSLFLPLCAGSGPGRAGTRIGPACRRSLCGQPAFCGCGGDAVRFCRKALVCAGPSFFLTCRSIRLSRRRPPPSSPPNRGMRQPGAHGPRGSRPKQAAKAATCSCPCVRH